MANYFEHVQGEDVKKFRETFFSESDCSEFYESDVIKLKTCDIYVKRFLARFTSEAVEAARKSLKWRKEMNVLDLTEDDFPEEWFHRGEVYVHNRDKGGHEILNINVKKHIKIPAMVDLQHKFLLFWLEKLFREEKGHKITVLYDLTDSGLANVDLGAVRFLIDSLKLYYPFFLADLIIFDLPWVMNAAWKVIRGWLGEEQRQKVKFVTRKDITELIDVDQLATHMGGTDTFRFHYIPENMQNGENGSVGLNDEEDFDQRQQVSTKVHFSGAENPGKSVDGNVAKNARVPIPVTSPTRTSRPSLETFVSTTPEPDLTITPNEVVFQTDHTKREVSTKINLSNNSEHDVAFKVKTTAPDKYKVKPATGCINANSAVKITVTLLEPGSLPHKDKFLVLSSRLDKDAMITAAHMVKFWKETQKEDIHEYRLRCLEQISDDCDTDHVEFGGDTTKLSDGTVLQRMNKVVMQNEKRLRMLEREMATTKYLLIIAVSLLIAILSALIYLRHT